MKLADAIDNLKKEHSELHTDIIDVRRLLRKKNKLLKELLSVTRKRQVGPATWLMLQQQEEEAASKKTYFPLMTQDKLDEFETTHALDLEIRDDIIKEVRSCIKSFGIKRSLYKILNPQLINYYNMKGTNNMHRLLDYPNFLKILFNAVEDKGLSYEEFIQQMRRAVTFSKLKFRDPTLAANSN